MPGSVVKPSMIRRLGPALAACAVLLFVACDKDGKDETRPAPPEPPVETTPPPPADERPAAPLPWLNAEDWACAQPGTAADPGFRVLYFRTPRDFGCGLLERQTFSNPRVLDFLKERAVLRFEDPQRVPELARSLGIVETPVLAVFGLDGSYAGAILGHRPPNALLEELRSLAAISMERRKHAAELAEQLKTVQGNARLEVLDAAARHAMEGRHFAAAEGWLRELVQIPGATGHAALPDFHARHARALAELGCADDADAAFERAIRHDSLRLNAEALAFERASVLLHAGRWKPALERLDAFLAAYPESARAEAAAFNRIFALLRLGDDHAAAKAMEVQLRTARSPEAQETLRLLLHQARPFAALIQDEGERQRVADALADGREVVRRFGCSDCHLGADPQAGGQGRSCIECHIFVRRLESETAKHADVVKAHPHFYRNCARIQHLLRAPSLTGLGARVRSAWIRQFLANPYDLRPHLEESMIQAQLGGREVEILMRYFAAQAQAEGRTPPRDDEAAPPRKQETIARGRGLFEKNRCHQCHQFGNARFAGEPGVWPWQEGRAEAPNLRHVRDRLTSRTAYEWIREPARLSPGTRMPKFDLAPDELDALVAFLFHGDPGPASEAPRPAPLRKPERPPGWDEVNAAIFQDTCVHCHQHDRAGGAGNTGAYGFAARRLDLSSYAGIRRGSLQPDGTRADILKPREGGKPSLLWERVARRVDENRRDHVAAFEDSLKDLARKRDDPFRPGMPLGHPALNPEQLGLLEAWLAAGAPGPQPQPLPEPKSKRKTLME